MTRVPMERKVPQRERQAGRHPARELPKPGHSLRQLHQFARFRQDVAAGAHSGRVRRRAAGGAADRGHPDR